MDSSEFPGCKCRQGIFNECKHQVESNISSLSFSELTIGGGDLTAILDEVATFFFIRLYLMSVKVYLEKPEQTGTARRRSLEHF